jgi:hypothetical protein
MTFPCIYVLYPELVHPLHFSPFYLTFLLMVISKVWKFYIHSCIESTSPIFTIFISFFYLLLLVSAIPLVWPVFHSCPSLFRFIVQWDFCLSIIPILALYLSQRKPPPLYFLVPFPHSVLCRSFQCFLVFVPTQIWCTSSLFTIFLSFSSSLGLFYQYLF